jgi:protein TonB
MDFARQQRDPKRHLIGISVVVLIHALVIYALLTGIGTKVIQVIKKPLTATIIEEIKLPPPPPPPPPPPKKIIEPPKIQPPVQPYVPPPDIPVPTPPSEPVISAVAPEPPKEPFVIAPPAPPAVEAPPAPPAPPPKPAVRRGITRLSGDDPQFPRAAIRAGVQKGRVVARVNIDEKGNVSNVVITTSDPPRVFDAAVRSALETWKFKAEGEKYVGEVEINFTLKDE